MHSVNPDPPAPQGALTPAARKILAAASELFYTRGIHVVGVEAVAAAAGVTKKTIYDRFGSKETLIAAYLDERSARWQRWLSDAIERAPGDQRLLAPFGALDSWLADQPRRGCAFVNAAAELPTADEHGRRVADREKRQMRHLFTELATDAHQPDPETLGAQLYMLHEGATVAYVLNGDDTAVATARSAAQRLCSSTTEQSS